MNSRTIRVTLTYGEAEALIRASLGHKPDALVALRARGKLREELLADCSYTPPALRGERSA